MEQRIRNAVADDAEALADIHACSWEAAYDGMISAEAIAKVNTGRPALWKRILGESNENDTFAVCDGERAAGFLVVGRSRDEGADTSACEIISLYLTPSHFGKGFGSLAMRHALAYAAELGYRTLTLWVLEKNIPAQQFYEKHGFRFDGSRKQIIIGEPMYELRYMLTL